MAISFSVLPHLKILPAKTPTVPPPPNLSDGILVDPLPWDLDIRSLLLAGCERSHNPTAAG